MNTPKNIAELDEMRARAALDLTTDEINEGVQYVLIRGLNAMGFEMPASATFELGVSMSRAIREADARAGLVTVPVKASYNMEIEGAHVICLRHGSETSWNDDARVVWASMIESSPFYTEPTT